MWDGTDWPEVTAVWKLDVVWRDGTVTCVRGQAGPST